MARAKYDDSYPSQNAAEESNPTAPFWRKSCLASPQMAGIPTTFQDDEVPQLDNWGSNEPVDLTGGALEYRSKQKRNAQPSSGKVKP